MRKSMRRIRCVLSTIALVLLAATYATAAQITIAWDANKEPDIASYVVQWGTAAAPYSTEINVGNVTTWNLTSAVVGTTYTFRVIAVNTAGARSDASNAVSGTVTAGGTVPAPAPTFSVERATLNFGVVKSGATVTRQTPSQVLMITQQGAGTMTWSVSTSAAWLKVSPATGSGSGAFTISLNTASIPASGNVDATLVITSPEASNSPQIVTVHLRQMAAGSSLPPSGAFDTPTNNSTNVAGAIPVTGWAIDDVNVEKVELWRDAVTGEPVAGNGKVFIGNAVFVSGARPDVETVAPDAPLNYRAGWGYLLLTNVLPDIAAGKTTGGNGSFTLYAYATDAEGNQTFLGSKRITLANAAAVKPFGTIDTPAQGETISGSSYVSFGWALASTSTIPFNGSTIDVYIDGVNMGHPTYNQNRTDIATAFPGFGNSNGAVGFFIFNTTTLTNGVHTIGWLATDAAGNAEGLGSRFFTVLNGVSAQVAGSQAAQTTAQSLVDVPVAYEAVEVRRAFTPENALSIEMPEYTGRVGLKSSELEQIELHLANEFTGNTGGSYEGYLVVRGELRPLPGGSSLDAVQGIFKWQPGAAFIGGYDFVFVRTDEAGNKTKVPVHLQIGAKFGGPRK
jgi:Fibronectin type III domain/Viral BACON domain/Bacterial Ig domain